VKEEYTHFPQNGSVVKEKCMANIPPPLPPPH
jgi:hypothetical protein